MTPTVDSFHPGISSYTGSDSAYASSIGGAQSMRLPPTRYSVHTRTLSRPSSTSSFVMHRPETLRCMTARRSATQSNQPQRRGRPVTAAELVADARRCSPTSSNSSVGKRPAAHARGVGLDDAEHVVDVARSEPRARRRAAAVVFDDVTYG